MNIVATGGFKQYANLYGRRSAPRLFEKGYTAMFDIDALDIYELEQLRDRVNRRLLQMRRTEGLRLPELLRLFEEVKITLQDQGKEWHSLERWQWMDGGIRFWLNPNEQDLYRSGWFSIDDLIAWTHDQGPIVIEEEVEEAEGGDVPWQQAGGVSITWLPKGRPGTSSTERDDIQFSLVS